MKIPTATYRIQLNKEFGFKQLKTIIPYLSELGVSHVYLSPIFKAVKNSTHGYDITDPNVINEELGGKRDFEDIVREAKAHGLELIQDIVPNHVAYTPNNSMISDLMRKGTNSRFLSFFDIDWNHPSKLNGKVLAPFLQKNLKACLQNQEIKLVFDKSFALTYKGENYPIKLETVKASLNQNAGFSDFASSNASSFQVEEVLNYFNQNAEVLEALVCNQIFGLENWRKAFETINYRRFFDILSLICLRTEEKEVFEYIHSLIFKLLKEGSISGVRVDHVDGLKDPMKYFQWFRKRAPLCYIVIEKILLDQEGLPSTWSVQGTTGYDFINFLNGIFVKSENEPLFESIYNRFTSTDNSHSFDQILNECKKFVAKKMFSGDIDNLTRMLYSAVNLHKDGYDLVDLREALIELVALFPVYRTYIDSNNSVEGIAYLEYSIKEARKRNRKLWTAFSEIGKLLHEESQEGLNFFIRLQQFTGSIMAKGFEDTALYRYVRLLSLNEVGSNPSKFGYSIRTFYDFQRKRQIKWPFSLSASSTHDTKRGEDARARLNVLSEIPLEFEEKIRRWASINEKEKILIRNKLAPDKNEEYYFYQTILGSFPFNEEEVPEFRKRMQIHVTKALREAKVHSNWLNPKRKYEKVTTNFVSKLLEFDKEFKEEFMPFQRKISFFGALNSISQTLIKITSPGIPDFYQGSELWNLSLVDPDNRRQIDFQKRQRFLKEIQESSIHLEPLLKEPNEGKIKLFEITRALNTRRKSKELFTEGKILPLKVRGPCSKNIIAFARKLGKKCAITIVPRFLTSLLEENEQIKRVNWKGTEIQLPECVNENWKDVFSKEVHVSKSLSGNGRLRVEEILKNFPVSLLIGVE